MARILVTGCLGYVGPAVISTLKQDFPKDELVGLDTGYFADQADDPSQIPEGILSSLIRKDVRDVTEEDVNGISSIVYLAALSNDPMGDRFGGVTKSVNEDAAVHLAEISSRKGIKNFTFASSASVYGVGGKDPRTEFDPLDPLTQYAKSKIQAEGRLQVLANSEFLVTCLRFATACGWSARPRLDLVLNDFVASAVISKKIVVLSDGTPWRPLIHTLDMARAISWSLSPARELLDDFVVANVGRDDWNFQIRDLAQHVARAIPGTEVLIDSNAQPDARSYSLDFAKWRKIAPDHQPKEDLIESIHELAERFRQLTDLDAGFRTSQRVRLVKLQRLVESGRLDSDLRWVQGCEAR
jgi:nucleoside-diphosphate-sugar epimerase